MIIPNIPTPNRRASRRGSSPIHFADRRRAPVDGEVAGFIASDGHWYIDVDGVDYLAEDIIWKMVYGIDPPGRIEHINGVKTDNRLENLRIAET